MHNPTTSQHQTVVTCMGQLWGCRLSGDSMLSGGNWTWLMTHVVAKQRSAKRAENTGTELSPGHRCSGSFGPLAGSSLHFFLFFLKTILQMLVWFSPVQLSPFPSLEVPIPLGEHQPALPSLSCEPARSPRRAPAELPPILIFPCSLCFSYHVFRPSSLRLILRQLVKLCTPRKLILNSSGEVSLPLTISTWNKKNVINSSCLLPLHKAPDYGLPFYYSLL